MQQVLNCLTVEHDWRLVLLAGVICILASLVAVSLFQCARASQCRKRRHWLALAGLCAGGGIWATHFVAMLAYRHAAPAAYDIGLTALSLVIATAATFAGLWVALAGTSRLAPVAGGAIIGLGIAAMHYTGIAALSVPGQAAWQADLTAAWLVLGAAFGAGALAVAARRDGAAATFVAALLFTTAILSLHFTGMAAMQFVPDTEQTAGPFAMSEPFLALTVAGVAIAILGMALLGAVADSRIAARQRRVAEAEAKLAEQNLRLDTALNNMSQGLVMFDAEGRLVVRNDRYMQIYGLDPEDMWPGILLEDLLERRRAKGVFPGDPVSHAKGVRATVVKGVGFSLTSELVDGRIIAVENRPMAGGGWVSTHEDITVRRLSEGQLRTQKLQLDTALDNMTQGLLMFDAQTRLVLYNQRYLQLYGLPAAAVRPGMPLRELLLLRKAYNTFARDPDRYIAELTAKMAAGEVLGLTTETPDGRILAVSNQPMAGGGWVSTHEDITRQRQAEERLREQKRQLDTALNTMTQGLNLLDSDDRLLVANERYRQMYRLPPEVLEPGATIEDLVRARIAAGTFFAVDAQDYMKTMRDRLNRREGGTLTMELTDGRTIMMQSQPTADGQGWVITHEDISERRRVEKERDRSTAFATSVIENVPTTIIVKDARTLRYLLINRAGERLCGVDRRDMIGKTAEDIFPQETAATVREHEQQVLSEKRTIAFDEHPSLMPNGEIRIIAITRVPVLDANGEPQYLLSVVQDRTVRKRNEAQIAHLAHHDLLTGLPNRAAFNACLESVLEDAARTQTPFAMMALDISRLKEINDVFGYGTGDQVLCELSRRMQACVGGALVARLGGDEFAIIANDGEQPEAAEQIAQRVQAALTEDVVVDGRRVQAGVTIGIAIHPQNGEDAATLAANANAALHRAKAEDRGSYRFFEADMDKRLRERRALQQDLSLAIERGQLLLHYQPQARVDGEVLGFEALVRWMHPARGTVPPGSFIPLAEESGLIIPIGEWILREACRQAASWPKPLNIAVNLSPVQFRHGDIAGLVHKVLLETGLAPQRLELEITEGVLIGDFSRALSVLRQLKAMGVRIAMDDFGTGYSSLNYLQAFPFDKIKIDRAFISNLETNPQSATIVRAVIGLARGFAVPVIAEGVETESQRSFLAAEGCDEVQGYLIGRPLPIENYASRVGRPIPLKRKTLRAEATG